MDQGKPEGVEKAGVELADRKAGLENARPENAGLKGLKHAGLEL